MANFEEAYQFDIRTRRDIQKNISPQGVPIVATDFTEGVVYEQNGVKVTSFVVDCSPSELVGQIGSNC